MYIPFIHKLPKKEKKESQIPLQIEKPIEPQQPKEKPEHEDKGPIIIPLF